MVTDANGDIWIMPTTNATSSYLKIEVSGSAASLVEVPVQYPDGYTSADYPYIQGPILAPNGSIYAFSGPSPGHSSPSAWFEIRPDGTQDSGTYDGSNLGNMGNTALVGDGRIVGMGDFYAADGTPTGGTISVNTMRTFDPETKAWTVKAITTGGPAWYPTSAVAANGTVFFHNAYEAYSFPSGPERFIAYQGSTTDIPGVPALPDGKLPNYFKHMLVERAGSDGVWISLGAMLAEGYFADPSIQAGETYEYRLTPVSTAGTPGIAGPTDTLTVPEP